MRRLNLWHSQQQRQQTHLMALSPGRHMQDNPGETIQVRQSR